jgi:ATP-dependent protease ClpP protease subunit
MFLRYLTMKRSILALLAGAVLATSAHADIVVKDRGTGWYNVKIINEITKSDYVTIRSKFMQLISDYIGDTPEDKMDELDKSNFPKFIFSLDSDGGDVEAAIKIGNFLRDLKSIAVVARNKVCLSACVFVLAGAPYRIIAGGKIGIHRPYNPNDKTTSAKDQKTKYFKMGAMIKRYLSKMNIKPKLYDDMLYINPENVRILSKKDLESYGLAGNDPFIFEAAAVRGAEKQKISRQEYAEQRAQENSKCLQETKGDYLGCKMKEIAENKKF